MFEGVIQKLISRIAGWKASLLSSGGKITLAQSVLSAMPIHILSAIPVPKGVINRMERLICAFLWDAGGEKRRHWVKAETVLQPYTNGGLNVRKLSEVMASLHARLAWKIINKTSPWAAFMASKYEENCRSRRSSLWNHIWPILSRIKAESIVEIRNGDCPLWNSPWCSPVLPKPPGCRFRGSIAQFLSSDLWKSQLLPSMPEHARKILTGFQLSSDPDLWRWTRHTSGIVTPRNYYQFATPRPPESKMWSKVWFRGIPRKLSFFLWKLRHKIFLVDSFFQQKGFHLASKCSCCNSPQIESPDHLFVRGDVAVNIWKWIGDLAQIPYGARNFKSLWRDFVSTSRLNSLAGATNLILFSAGIWEIWKFRCSVRYGNSSPVLRELPLKLSWCSLVRLRLAPLLPKLNKTHTLQHPPRKSWQPSPQILTVNIACKGHVVAFICRDSQGTLLGGGASEYNSEMPFPGLRQAVLCSTKFCNASQVSSFSLQWDRDVGSSAARKWAASSVANTLIARSANEAARALASHAADNPLPQAGVLLREDFPLPVLGLISIDASLIPGGSGDRAAPSLIPSGLPVCPAPM